MVKNVVSTKLTIFIVRLLLFCVIFNHSVMILMSLRVNLSLSLSTYNICNLKIYTDFIP